MTDWSAYDTFIDEAEKEDRIGEHDAVVDSIELGSWPSGDKRYKIQFMLITARMAKADLTLNELETPEELEARAPTMEQWQKRKAAQETKIYRVLAQHYNVMDLMKIERGDTFRVKTYKTKVDPITQKGGFIRVGMILEKQGDIEAPATPQF